MTIESTADARGATIRQPPADGASPRPVPWVARLTPAVHGAVAAPAAAPDEDATARVLDFSANGNVLGPSPAVRDAIARVDLARYPDREARALRRAIATHHAVNAEAVLVGNGSTELIWAIARAYLAPRDRAIVLGPTYGEYAVASAACGAEVQRWTAIAPAEEAEGGHPTFDAATLGARLGETRPGLVWLCHPNNPTGAPFPVDAVPVLAAAAPGALFVVDEAYLPLTDGLPSAQPLLTTGRVVVVRSLTKDAGLAGLRVGYALAAPAIVDAVRRVVPPWSVNALAQAAAVAALADRDYAGRVRAAVAASRAHLVGGLAQLGLRPYPSVANFVLVPVGDGRAVTQALLARGLAVRDCTSFSLPGCIRIGVRSMEDQSVLLAGLAEVIPGAVLS
jgi:histidinol-phosphate aminotransferase